MSYQLEFRHLRYFLAVAEDLHFRKAAEKLFISQPGLSRQIKELEQDLKLDLFERHNRKVELTATGKYLQKEITGLFRQLDEVLAHATMLDNGFTGSLKLGYVGSAMQSVIPRFLLNIREEFPKVLFDLKEMDNQQQIEAILNQQIDIGFVRLDRVPEEIEMHPVLEDTFSLVLPASHSIDETSFIDLSQFKDEKFILFDPSYSRSYYEKVMGIFDQSNFKPIISHKTVHASTIYNLVENNFGVSIVPTSLQIGYDMGIKFIELNHLSHRTTLRAIWNKKNRHSLLTNILGLIELS